MVRDVLIKLKCMGAFSFLLCSLLRNEFPHGASKVALFKTIDGTRSRKCRHVLGHEGRVIA